VIGYYVHHHGAGHVTRAALLAERLSRRGVTVTGLSSLPRPAGWAGPWLRLPHDAVPAPDELADPTAGGTLHWAPTGHDGHTGRMAAIAGWVADERPRLVVVDVSVEVAVFVRLMGVPVAVVAMRGDRTDAPHVLAYDLADALVAFWPEGVASESWPQRWLDKTAHVGALSRLDDLAAAGADAETTAAQAISDDGVADSRVEATEPGGGPREVLLLWGRGGEGSGPDVEAARAATAGAWTWSRPPVHATAAELVDLLAQADVVVVHGGQNAVAEVAAARRPAVVVAEDRPFDEQVETATVLDRHGIAVGLTRWPEPTEWPAVLDRAAVLGGAGWAKWSDRGAADRAADVLTGLAGRR
jgi:hypothetical protein